MLKIKRDILIFDDELWDYCQAQAPKNLRHYKREKDYIFLQKLNCPTCGRTLGGKATRKKMELIITIIIVWFVIII